MSGKAPCELPSHRAVVFLLRLRARLGAPGGRLGLPGACLSRTHPVAVLLLRGRFGTPKACQHTEGLLLYRERLFL